MAGIGVSWKAQKSTTHLISMFQPQKRHSICLVPPNSESTQLKKLLGRKDPRRALVT